MINILSLKRQGVSDSIIAEELASSRGIDYKGLRSQGVTDQVIISELNKAQGGPVEAFKAGFSQEAGSEITGLRQILGREPTEEELMAETRMQSLREQSPVAGWAGTLAGSIVNPSSLIPGSLLFKGAKGLITGGAAAGAVGGALRPLYTPDESRLESAAIGAGAGAVLGGALAGASDIVGRLFKKEIDNVNVGRRTIDDAVQQTTDTTQTTTPATFESPEVQRIIEEMGSTGAVPRQAALLSEQPPRMGFAEFMQREQARVAPGEAVQQEAALLRPITEEAPTGPTGLARVMQMEQQRLAEDQPNVGALLTKRSDDYFTQTARVADEGISTPKVQQLAKDTGQDIRTVLKDVKASDDVLKALDEANLTQLPKTFDEAIDVLENTPSLRRILDACL
tara:strand:- start:2604 stop:3791 length:1188 start_codon:yes stop_codon:yes gene_type:complete